MRIMQDTLRTASWTALLLLVGPFVGLGQTQPVPSTSAAAQSSPSSPPASASGMSVSSKAAAQQALALARQGHYEEAVKLLDEILVNNPRYAKARVLRAKLYMRLKAYNKAFSDIDRVLKDIELMVKDLPSFKEAQALRKTIDEEQKTKKSSTRESPKRRSSSSESAAATAQKGQKSPGEQKGDPVIKGDAIVAAEGPPGYSREDRVFTISGKTTFSLKDYQGPDGFTIFYVPAMPGDRTETNPYMSDSAREHLYFLRLIDLSGAGGRPDLSLPAAKDLKITAVPHLIVVDPAGKEVARGDPYALEDRMDQIRKEAREKTPGNRQ
jgi:hypothetical protein